MAIPWLLAVFNRTSTRGLPLFLASEFLQTFLAHFAWVLSLSYSESELHAAGSRENLRFF
jgi:hypothetical protein